MADRRPTGTQSGLERHMHAEMQKNASRKGLGPSGFIIRKELVKARSRQRRKTADGCEDVFWIFFFFVLKCVCVETAL